MKKGINTTFSFKIFVYNIHFFVLNLGHTEKC